MKRKCKIVLDVVMLLMTLTLFNKQFIGMKYHEIAGLVLLAAVLTHIAVNLRTVRAMCKKFAKVPAAVKTGLVVDVLLLVCFAWIGISGVLISRTILTGISSSAILFKVSHMFAGGASVILLGVHIGLHLCRRPMPAAVAIVLSVVVFCAGIYGVVNSSQTRWLTMPFAATAQHGEGYGQSAADKMEGQPDGEWHPGQGQGKGQGKGQMFQNGNGRGHQPLSAAEKVRDVGMFSGMILSWAMITYWVVILGKKRAPRRAGTEPRPD